MNLVDLLESLNATPPPAKETEADTRARVVDPLLEALGWSQHSISREPYLGWKLSRGFADYLMKIGGKPFLVLETKKVGRTFDLPRSVIDHRCSTFGRLQAVGNTDLLEALQQCVDYATFCGAQYSCATNGEDWLFFKPNHPHRPLPEAKILIFNGFKDILKNIDQFCDLLKEECLEKGQAERHLVGRPMRVPNFARRLRDLFPNKGFESAEAIEFANILDSMLKYYVEDLGDESTFEACYIPVNVNRRAAGSIDAIILNKASELIPGSQMGGIAFADSLISLDEFSGGAVGRLIVLHGAIGVGKSSFLRNCKMSLLKSKAKDSVVWAHINLIDFSDRPFMKDSTSDMLNLICRKLQGAVALSGETLNGNFDPDEWHHLRDIYNAEVRRFQKSMFSGSSDKDENFIKAAREYVWSLREADPQEHLVRILRWFTTTCKLPVVLALDNSDQLGLDFQEFLYKLAESLQQRTSSVTILTIRTEALVSHRIREHALATVHEQFAVEKAPLALVLERRFDAIERKLNSLQSGESPKRKIVIDRLKALMNAIQYEAHVGSDAFVILDSIGNESLREKLRGVAAVFRDDPKRMDQLVAIEARGLQPRLRGDRVIKAMLRQSQLIADPHPLIPNIFCSEASLELPYTLVIRIAQQVRGKSNSNQYLIKDCLNDFALAGVEREVVKRVIDKMLFDKVLTVQHMLREISEDDPIRLTPLGEMLTTVMTRYPIYYEQFVFDAFIYDEQKFGDMRNLWNSRGEAWKRFHGLARTFISLLKQSDQELRDSLVLANLEPILAHELSFPDIPQESL